MYVSGFVNFDFQIYDMRDPAHPRKIVDWTIENPELHRGIGAMDGKYFKIGDKYYYVQSCQFMQGSPDADLGAVVFDVTGLPDSSKVKVVARIRYPEGAGRLPQHLRLQALRRPGAAVRHGRASPTRWSTTWARW